MNLGKSLDLVNQGHPSTSGWILPLFEGKKQTILDSLPRKLHLNVDMGWERKTVTDAESLEYFVDVQDAALLHVAAAILPDVKGERIFGFAEPFCWDDILEILRKQNPKKKFHENFAGEPYQAVIKPRERAEELLKRLGKSGWTSLEDSLWLNTEDLRD